VSGQTPEITNHSLDIHSKLERILQPVQQFVGKFTHILLEERQKPRVNRNTNQKAFSRSTGFTNLPKYNPTGIAVPTQLKGARN